MARFVKKGEKPRTSSAPKDRVNWLAEGFSEEKEPVRSAPRPTVAPKAAEKGEKGEK